MISAACLPLPRRAPCTCDISGNTDVASTKALQMAQALCKSGYQAVCDSTSLSLQKGKNMKSKRISFGQGKGSITHNNRTFIANNVDKKRIADNITFISKPIGEVYDELFDDAVERYNARQKRNDRKIHGTYYEHLFHCNRSLIYVSPLYDLSIKSRFGMLLE